MSQHEENKDTMIAEAILFIGGTQVQTKVALSWLGKPSLDWTNIKLVSPISLHYVQENNAGFPPEYNVYLLQYSNSDSYRVGTCENVMQTVNLLQEATPHPLKVVIASPGGEYFHDYLHTKYLNGQSTQGWFTLEENEVLTIIHEFGLQIQHHSKPKDESKKTNYLLPPPTRSAVPLRDSVELAREHHDGANKFQIVIDSDLRRAPSGSDTDDLSSEASSNTPNPDEDMFSLFEESPFPVLEEYKFTCGYSVEDVVCNRPARDVLSHLNPNNWRCTQHARLEASPMSNIVPLHMGISSLLNMIASVVGSKYRYISSAHLAWNLKTNKPLLDNTDTTYYSHLVQPHYYLTSKIGSTAVWNECTNTQIGEIKFPLLPAIDRVFLLENNIIFYATREVCRVCNILTGEELFIQHKGWVEPLLSNYVVIYTDKLSIYSLANKRFVAQWELRNPNMRGTITPQGRLILPITEGVNVFNAKACTTYTLGHLGGGYVSGKEFIPNYFRDGNYSYKILDNNLIAVMLEGEIRVWDFQRIKMKHVICHSNDIIYVEKYTDNKLFVRTKSEVGVYSLESGNICFRHSLGESKVGSIIPEIICGKYIICSGEHVLNVADLVTGKILFSMAVLSSAPKIYTLSDTIFLLNDHATNSVWSINMRKQIFVLDQSTNLIPIKCEFFHGKILIMTTTDNMLAIWDLFLNNRVAYIEATLQE